MVSASKSRPHRKTRRGARARVRAADRTASANGRRKARVQQARTDMYRRLIVEAAEALFADRGVGDARMEAIAAEAGLSLGTLYTVFAGKSAIVRAVHDTRLREVLQRAVDATRGMSDPLAMLLAGVRTYVRFFLAHPNYLRMHLRDGYSWAIVAASASTRVQADAWREGVSMQAALFARGVADGTFYAGDPQVLTRTMIAMQQVQLASWVEGGMTRDPDELLAEIEAQVRRTFCPAAAPVAPATASGRTGHR